MAVYNSYAPSHQEAVTFLPCIVWNSTKRGPGLRPLSAIVCSQQSEYFGSLQLTHRLASGLRYHHVAPNQAPHLGQCQYMSRIALTPKKAIQPMAKEAKTTSLWSTR